MEDLAGMLYESLQTKIIPLNEDVIVYPAHGPGSSCGKNLGPYTYSTIGEEKQTNYALKAQDKKGFIKAVTEGLLAPPQYFPINAKINKEGYESLDTVLEKSLNPLSIQQVKKAITDEVLILDTRNEEVFTNGFIPNSVSIALEGRFAEWAGSLLPFEQPIIIVTEIGREKEAIIRLARVGFSNVMGYVDGGFEAWKKAGEEIDLIINVEADELAMDIPFDENLVVVDVRKPTEFAESHVKSAINIPLDEMNDPVIFSDFDDTQNIYVHCQSGYRSVIASSLLKRQGIHNIRNIVGGYNKIIEQKKIKTEKESSVLN
jgi:hydroxyacylglutathione hydrolase